MGDPISEKRSILSYVHAGWVVFTHDVLWVPASLLMAYLIRFNFQGIGDFFFAGFFWMLMASVPVQVGFFWLFGISRGMWRFTSLSDLLRILQAVAAGTVGLFVVVFLIFRLAGVPRSVFFLYFIHLSVVLSVPRLVYRWLRERDFRLRRSFGKPALIVGAGREGEILARDLLRDGRFQPVCFVDDHPEVVGRAIHGIPVRGGTGDLESLVERLRVGAVLIADPEADQSRIDRVTRVCWKWKVPCRILPSLSTLADEGGVLSRLRPLEVEDLLGRKPVTLNDEAVAGLIGGRVVLVTGGGGSIGSELCRQVAAYGPSHLVILESNEFNLFNQERALSEGFPGVPLSAFLGSVCDGPRVEWIFSRFRPAVVFHSAAYKHVPLVEKNPAEGVLNNIGGTQVLADAAAAFGCERFVLVSTDKAVNPGNVMGTTKRVAELYCQNLNARTATRFITTRFGNVLGSAGSVVPLFREQIEKGGPVTVTHAEITRFFMTIPEAASLILQAAAMGRGGEIFVLDMGRPVKIADLAEQMIRLSGLEPGLDIDIKFTGLRPGEKMHEELFHKGEQATATSHPSLLLAESRQTSFEVLSDRIAVLLDAARKRDEAALVALLSEIVPEADLSELPGGGAAVPPATGDSRPS